MRYHLSPTKQKAFNKKLYAFDIETSGDDNDFLFGSIVSEDGTNKVFFDKEKMIQEILSLNKYRNSWICATNLQFDFNALFYGSDHYKEFRHMFRGSDLISMKSYMHKGKFHYLKPNNAYGITFIDSLNYAKSGVAQLGKFIGKPKLKAPIKLGSIPKNQDEWDKFIEYNIRDSEITLKATRSLIDCFTKLGATPKLTIASTAMSLFKNKFLDKTYFIHDIDVILQQFEGYYGGRTEAFARGKIKNCYYYDVNSLYPSVMQNEFPDPNTLRTRRLGIMDYIKNYEGMSFVTVKRSRCGIPLLPFRKDGKLLYPYGVFSGAYTHVEIRKALSEGYEILDIGWQHYYKSNCRPFYGYVNYLYTERKKYPSGSIMNLVCKILMNSLYGKFGQKFMDRDSIIHEDNITPDTIKNNNFLEKIGDSRYYRMKKNCDPPSFSFPIWACYVTAYGRIRLYDHMKECVPLYCDTDSIITQSMAFPHSDELGKMKLEKVIKEGLLIKPKMYNTDGEIKIKGFYREAGKERIDEDTLKKILDHRKISFERFAKTKESLRRNLKPNQKIVIPYDIDLEDNKRVWNGLFNPEVLQFSEARCIIDHTEAFAFTKQKIYNKTHITDECEINGETGNKDHG